MSWIGEFWVNNLKPEFMNSYRLNLNQQANSDYEVYALGCPYAPTQNFDELEHLVLVSL